MLTRLSVKGFKTLVDFDVPLSKVTVLVGPNNCGKSNVLKALDYLSRVVRTNAYVAAEQSGGLESLRSRGRSAQVELRLWAKLGEWSYEYRFRPQQAVDPGEEYLLVQGPSRIEAWFTPGGAQLQIDGKTAQPPHAGMAGDLLRNAAQMNDAVPSVRAFYDFISGVTVADFSTAAIRKPSQISANAEMSSTGEGLAAVLDRLDGERPDLRTAIDTEVSQVVGRVTKVVTIPASQQGYKVVGVAEGRDVFRGEAVSDGVLLYVALTTVTQMSGGKTIVCLEEPDRGIHPRRIREVLDQVYRLANAGSQFILTTHSPVLLNEFRDYPESVLILDRDDAGTHAKQLSELPDVEAQMKDVQLGDLWYSGVLGGVPKR